MFPKPHTHHTWLKISVNQRSDPTVHEYHAMLGVPIYVQLYRVYIYIYIVYVYIYVYIYM